MQGQLISAKAELLKMMKDAGFGAIRVPVTWYNHMDKDGKVDAAWMARVHEVVDYVINQGLYCIINVHHDTGADNEKFKSWIKADEANYAQNKERYENLWRQIAEEFKDYGQLLLFESYNEMLDKYSSWCFASMNASGGYNASDATSAYNAINSYAQSFVKTVRGTGGNLLIYPWIDELADLPKANYFKALAERMDREIHRGYELFPCNYIALDELNGNTANASHYTEADRQRFEKYLAGQLDKIQLPDKDLPYLRERILTMYANPVRNKKSAGNG